MANVASPDLTKTPWRALTLRRSPGGRTRHQSPYTGDVTVVDVGGGGWLADAQFGAKSAADERALLAWVNGLVENPLDTSDLVLPAWYHAEEGQNLSLTAASSLAASGHLSLAVSAPNGDWTPAAGDWFTLGHRLYQVASWAANRTILALPGSGAHASGSAVRFVDPYIRIRVPGDVAGWGPTVAKRAGRGGGLSVVALTLEEAV